MRILQMPDAIRYRGMTTAQLRESFLLDDLFQPGTIQNVYVDLDRTVIGSAVPLHQPLALPTYPELRADCFTERRELGVLNIGAPGKVRVDSETFALENLDCLYIGRGNHEIVFSSEDATHPAEFYLLSYPAHAEYPTRLVAACRSRAGFIGDNGHSQCSPDPQTHPSGRCAKLPAGSGLYRNAAGKRLEHNAAPHPHATLRNLSLLQSATGGSRDSHDGASG